MSDHSTGTPQCVPQPTTAPTHGKPSGGIVEPFRGATLPAMPAQPHPEQSASRLDDCRFRLVLEAEVFVDPDGDNDSLIVTTDDLACEPVSPSRLLRMVAEARAKLDEIERLAKVYEAEAAIRAIVAEHRINLLERDLATLEPPELREKFVAFADLDDDGQLVIVVPTGQDPVRRAGILADLARIYAAGDAS